MGPAVGLIGRRGGLLGNMLLFNGPDVTNELGGRNGMGVVDCW
jgi:hypothetical protein